jgi:uncharacterized protein (DUF1015 family)
MAEFKPVSGLRYNTELVGVLDDVVAPPYDVINDAQVAELQAKSQYNVTHLTRPVGDDPYGVAAELFAAWKAQGALVPEDKAAFYIYRQSFTDPDTGSEFPERVGVIGILKLEEYSTGKVLPHELTLSAARADRLNPLFRSGWRCRLCD